MNRSGYQLGSASGESWREELYATGRLRDRQAGTKESRMDATELIWRRASCFLTGTMPLNRLTLAAATMTLLVALPQDGRTQSATTDTTSAKRMTLAPGDQYR